MKLFLEESMDVKIAGSITVKICEKKDQRFIRKLLFFKPQASLSSFIDTEAASHKIFFTLQGYWRIQRIKFLVNTILEQLKIPGVLLVVFLEKFMEELLEETV